MVDGGRWGEKQGQGMEQEYSKRMAAVDNDKEWDRLYKASEPKSPTGLILRTKECC